MLCPKGLYEGLALGQINPSERVYHPPPSALHSFCPFHSLHGLQIGSIPEPNVILVALSPLKNFVVTCTKPVKDQDGQPGNNLKVPGYWGSHFDGG